MSADPHHRRRESFARRNLRRAFCPPPSNIYAPWPREAIEHFSTHARRDLWHAAALALYTGQRQSDVLAMKWSDIADAFIAVTQGKTGKKLWVPLHTRLRGAPAELERVSVFIYIRRARRRS